MNINKVENIVQGSDETASRNEMSAVSFCIYVWGMDMDVCVGLECEYVEWRQDSTQQQLEHYRNVSQRQRRT
jgi:hypothetical protein